MEFKKSNSYSNGRTRLTVPQRGDESIVSPPTGKPVAQVHSVIPSRIRRLPVSRKNLVIGGVSLVVIIFIIIGFAIHQNNLAKKAGAASVHKIITDPGYQTVLPDGKSISDFGGWQRISPPQSDPVYAYTDKLADTSISISEQPLPKTFEGDAESHVAELAKKFNATAKVTAGDTTVYLGTSAKGPQSALFIKINLLVLIKSQNKISDDAWIKYIKALN